jgi:putative transcriptional regulator
MPLAGSFLVARPVLKDPTFAQTVVLLLAHTPEGAFGLVVNRPVAAEGLPLPLFDGGPCQSPGVVILHGNPDWAEPAGISANPDAPPEVAPGVFVGDASCLNRAGEETSGQPPRCRVFRGFAGWGTGQLEQELAAGAWAVVKATGQLLFDTPVEEMWDRLSPPSIPQPSLN